jgi:thiosulfate dehydrogenase
VDASSAQSPIALATTDELARVGGLLQTGEMRWTIDRTKPVGDHIRDVWVGDRRRVTLLVLLSMAACSRTSNQVVAVQKPASSTTGPMDYTPPADSLIPNDELGASIRRGLALIIHTTDSLSAYAPSTLQCASCHIDAGRRRDAAGLLGAYSRFPKYMDRAGAVVPVEDRINYCFTRSLAGSRIPDDSREMQDIVAYVAYISRGVPVGRHVIGEGMPAMPKLSGDSARGSLIFAQACAVCHGQDGQGNPPAFPALWGSKSFSIGASMARQERAATFIKHFMPQNNPGSLNDQQAYDVAAFVDSHARPDSPGKEADWPSGGAPYDVPYNTKGHVAFHPPSAKLFPRPHAELALVPPPSSVTTKR